MPILLQKRRSGKMQPGQGRWEALVGQGLREALVGQGLRAQENYSKNYIPILRL
jgi:hypothetical protein